MKDPQHDPAKLKRAIKRLIILKGFYNHLVVYLVFNLLGLALFIAYRVFYMDKLGYPDPHFSKWINRNIILTPILWGFGLFIHWLYAYYRKPRFLRDWEDRQMKKYMEK